MTRQELIILQGSKCPKKEASVEKNSVSQKSTSLMVWMETWTILESLRLRLCNSNHTSILQYEHATHFFTDIPFGVPFFRCGSLNFQRGFVGPRCFTIAAVESDKFDMFPRSIELLIAVWFFFLSLPKEESLTPLPLPDIKFPLKLLCRL